jgi:hypothetical protein
MTFATRSRHVAGACSLLPLQQELLRVELGSFMLRVVLVSQ